MFSFTTSNIWEKVKNIEASCDAALLLTERFDVPDEPARDAEVLHPKLHPPKKGFASLEGQARMLHDLANIELQAMELGLRTLSEFPEASEQFKAELRAITLQEADHLRMCLEGIESLGFQWGDWPVHLALWRAVSPEDSLLDRILIVHRYLEGSGLDAGDTLIRRLEGTPTKKLVQPILKQINFEEIAHVDFGSQWYRRVCAIEKIDPNVDFFTRMDSLRVQLPKRVEPIHRELRTKAGFTPEEISYYEDLRLNFLNKQII